MLCLGVDNNYTNYSKYTLPNKGKSSNKFGIRMQPTEGLIIRGSFGSNFRAPSLDLFSGSGYYWTWVTLANGSNGYEKANQVGNPDLKAETADQYNIGFVWSPNSTFNMSASYYNIKISDQITFASAQDVIELDNQGLLHLFPSLAINQNDTGITSIDTSYINYDGYQTDGLDLDMNVNIDINDDNHLALSFNGSWVGSFTYKESILSPRVEALSSEEYGEPLYPRYRYAYGATYYYKNL